jgi:hypothetical protein
MPINSILPTEKNPIKISQMLRDLASGRSNANSTFSLPADGTSTSCTVSAQNCGPLSHISIEATNAAGAQEKASGSFYVTAKAQGSFTVACRASSTLRTFSYGIQG